MPGSTSGGRRLQSGRFVALPVLLPWRVPNGPRCDTRSVGADLFLTRRGRSRRGHGRNGIGDLGFCAVLLLPRRARAEQFEGGHRGPTGRVLVEEVLHAGGTGADEAHAFRAVGLAQRLLECLGPRSVFGLQLLHHLVDAGVAYGAPPRRHVEQPGRIAGEGEVSVEHGQFIKQAVQHRLGVRLWVSVKRPEKRGELAVHASQGAERGPKSDGGRSGVRRKRVVADGYGALRAAHHHIAGGDTLNGVSGSRDVPFERKPPSPGHDRRRRAGAGEVPLAGRVHPERLSRIPVGTLGVQDGANLGGESQPVGIQALGNGDGDEPGFTAVGAVRIVLGDGDRPPTQLVETADAFAHRVGRLEGHHRHGDVDAAIDAGLQGVAATAPCRRCESGAVKDAGHGPFG